MPTLYKNLATKLVHAGEPEPRINGAVSMPIFQSAMFEYAGETNYHDLKYIRLNNTPNHLALHKKLAALENNERRRRGGGTIYETYHAAHHCAQPWRP